MNRTPFSHKLRQSSIIRLADLLLRFLLIFCLGKILFMMWNAEEEAITASDAWQVWKNGLSMDISTSGYLIAIPWLCALIGIWWKRFPYRWILVPYFIVVSILLTLIIGGDALLYEFWKFKINATVFAYMQNPQGATSSVSIWFIAGCITALVATILFVGFILLRSLFIRYSAPKTERPSSVTSMMGKTLLHLFVGGLIFLGIRGGVQESVMNVGKAYFSQRLFLNHAAVNPVFSLLSSISKNKRFSQQFNYLSEEKRAKTFDGLYPDLTDDQLTDTLLRTQRPHILIVMMESFGGKFVKELGGIPDVAPHFSRLIPEGVFWENYYSNSFRTDRGTVSLFSGWVSYPTASLMRLPEKLNHIPAIPRSLAEAGYATDYLYAGDIEIMNKKGYLIASGYQQFTSDKDFPLEQVNDSKWGVNDGNSARRTFEMIASRPLDKPWHMGYQTLSSHEPFEVPYQRLSDKALNAFAYTDECVGQLIDSLRTLPVWDNLLVILLPDHGFLYELTYEDPEFFHSPMLWLGGAIREPRRMQVLMNQSDLAATLLAQLGLPYKHFPWSRNVLGTTYTYPFVYSTFPSGILFSDSTGVSVFDITSNTPITEQPTPSPQRIQKAKAILQTSYDGLE